jgi:hypothetical protein
MTFFIFSLSVKNRSRRDHVGFYYTDKGPGWQYQWLSGAGLRSRFGQLREVAGTFRKRSSEIIVASIHGNAAAGACLIIVPVRAFDHVSAGVALYHVSNYLLHFE